MARLLHRNFPHLFRKWNSVLLALYWCAGLIFGGIGFRCTGNSFLSLMRMVPGGPVSIVSLLTSLLLPFLFSAFAVSCSMPRLLYGVCFFRAFLFSFVSCGTAAAFGSAGWLVWLIFMLPDVVCAAVLYLYCLRHISGHRRFSGLEAGVCMMTAAMLGSLDYFYISPFLAGIFTF